MTQVINLHPNSNYGETVLATVEYLHRITSLKFSVHGYGNHYTELQINLNPEQLIELGQACIEVGQYANEFHKKTP